MQPKETPTMPGRSRNVEAPTPNWPTLFCPHAQTAPARSIPYTVDPPETTCTRDTPDGTSTCVGPELLATLPLPICPNRSCPHAHTDRFAKMATVCPLSPELPPRETCCTFSGRSTWTGVSL